MSGERWPAGSVLLARVSPLAAAGGLARPADRRDLVHRLAGAGGGCLGAVHHELEVDRPAPLVAVVVDVLRPRFALDVD